MGYTHKELSMFIPPSAIQKSAGTWTPTIASNVVSDSRTASAASFTLVIPIVPPFQSSGYREGAKLNSIDVYYKIATTAASVFTLALNKITLPANAAAPTGAAVTGVTLDTLHDTEAECYAIGDHTATITVDNPAWIDDGEFYALTIAVTAAAGTVFTLYGARANFTLRT